MYFGCGVCKHFNQDSVNCTAFPEGLPLPIVSGELFHTIPFFDQENDVVYEEREDFKFEFIFKNRDRFPDAELFDLKDCKIIGKFGELTLILVGYDPGDEALVVSSQYNSTLDSEEVSIVSLSSLMTMNPYDVKLYNYYPDAPDGQADTESDN